MHRGKRGCGCGMAVLLLVLLAAIAALLLLNTRVGVPDNTAASALLLDPPQPLSEPIELKVVTFNIQNLPLIGQHSAERMRAIGAKLMVLDPDIVGFQESFVGRDRDLLLAELAYTRLQHYQYYSSGIVGSGLLIASAFPIEEVYFHRYTRSSGWYMVHEGDYWAGKGAALARLALPGGYLDFYNTHAQANYGKDAYRDIRESQLLEFAEFITRSHVPTAPGIVAGDINARVDARDYIAFVDAADLVSLMTIPSRVDHIFARSSDLYDFEVVETIEISEKVVVNQKEFDLSDHNGYMSHIRITPAGAAQPGTTP